MVARPFATNPCFSSLLQKTRAKNQGQNESACFAPKAGTIKQKRNGHFPKLTDVTKNAHSQTSTDVPIKNFYYD